MQGILLFVLGLFLLAAVFKVHFFFYLLYTFFGVYFVSRMWLEQSLAAISCRREYTMRAFFGERAQVKVHVRNKSLLPVPYLRLHESVPTQLKSPNFFRSVVSLWPKERTSFSYELDCRRRGYYPLGPLTISSGDLFGIGQRESQIPSEDHILVYPPIVPLTQLGLPAQTPFGSTATKQRIYEDPSRLMGIREYQSGDSLRHIHWKTTATTGTLQVKRFEPAISIEAQIFLNLNRSEYTLRRASGATELAIETAASIANHLVEQRQTVGLSCNGADPLLPEAREIVLKPRKGREQLTRIMDILARVQATEERPFVELLRQARLHLSWGGTAIVITSHATDEQIDQLVAMKRSGFHVVLIVMDPRTPFAIVEQHAKQLGIKAYQIWQESDLDVWR